MRNKEGGKGQGEPGVKREGDGTIRRESVRRRNGEG
jgi:hypothetical protein